MKQRLLFGTPVSLGRVALRGAVGGSFAFEAPKFGPHCVCCNADTQGRTQDYDPSTDRIRAAAVPMPVCIECKDHALSTPLAPIMQAIGVMMALALAGLGASYATKPLSHRIGLGMIGAGVLLLAISIVWIRATSRRKQRGRIAGHFPGLEISLGSGATLLDTENETLVEELLALNEKARRMQTPLFWRLRGEGMPKARVVEAPRDKK